MAAIDPVTGLVNLGTTLLDKFFPDADSAMKEKMQLFLTTFAAQADIIKTEAASQGVLARNWRPITMLVFVGLIVARWFGWAAPNLSEGEYLKLWDIVQLGIGGYVVGRSVEKVVPAITEALKR